MTDSKPDIKPSGSALGPGAAFEQEPEEHLHVSSSYNQSFVWAIKVPRFLLEQWEQVEEEGVELGTLVVDASTKPERITLRLPNTEETDEPLVALPSSSSTSQAGPSRIRRRYDTRNLPDEYEVRYHPAKVRNTFVFSETIRTPQPIKDDGRRKKEKANPSLLSRVQHEATLQPVRTPKYLRILQQRQLEAQGSKRPIIQLEQSGMSEARLAQLASGYNNWKSDFGKGVSTSTTRSLDRALRLPRPQLTDRLFALFAERPYWGIKALRETLKQPDVWLREVLKDVGEVVDEGPYRNMWKLKESWRALEEEGRRVGGVPGAGTGGAAGAGGVKGEKDADKDDEDEDGEEGEWDDDWEEGDEDMEEVRME